MTNAPQEHRWVVDGIEEGVARLEEDGTRVFTLPVTFLPAGVREGQVLKVVFAAAATTGSSVLTLSVDDSATSAAREKSRLQVAAIAKASKKRDPGGDVAL